MFNKVFTLIIILSFLIPNIFGDIKNRIEISDNTEQSDIINVYSSEGNFLPQTKNLDKTKFLKKSNVFKRVKFELPDLFYFIGAPIFLIILLRVIAVYIKLFEEEREREIRDISLEEKDSD